MWKAHLGPARVDRMPLTQFGAVPKRGADVATLLIRAALGAAHLKNLSVVVLFVDLVKAFDRVIREL
eukprot:6540074-Pyramimonas_sp.AAC.1